MRGRVRQVRGAGGNLNLGCRPHSTPRAAALRAPQGPIDLFSMINSQLTIATDTGVDAFVYRVFKGCEPLFQHYKTRLMDAMRGAAGEALRHAARPPAGRVRGREGGIGA